MSGFGFSSVGFVGSLITSAGATPSTALTLARWSAAEGAGNSGGLDASNNWPALFGGVTLLNAGPAPFVYSATAPGNVKGLVAAVAGSSFSLAGLTFPNSSAASILVFFSAGTAVQILFEYGPFVNTTPGTFAAYTETNNSEHYLNIGGGKTLTNNPQITTRTTMLAARYYAGPPRILTAAQNGIASAATGNDASVAGGFTAQTLYVGSRTNNTYFFAGTLCALHLFHTAPSDADFAAWVSYYTSLYGIV